MKQMLIALAVALVTVSCDAPTAPSRTLAEPIYEFTFPEVSELDPPSGEAVMSPMRCVAVQQLSNPENLNFLRRYIGNGYADYQRDLVERAGLADQPLGRVLGIDPSSHFTGQPGDRIQIFSDHLIVDKRNPVEPEADEREPYWFGEHTADDGFGPRILITQNAACVFSAAVSRDMRVRERLDTRCATNPTSDLCSRRTPQPE